MKNLVLLATLFTLLFLAGCASTSDSYIVSYNYSKSDGTNSDTLVDFMYCAKYADSFYYIYPNKVDVKTVLRIDTVYDDSSLGYTAVAFMDTTYRYLMNVDGPFWFNDSGNERIINAYNFAGEIASELYYKKEKNKEVNHPQKRGYPAPVGQFLRDGYTRFIGNTSTILEDSTRLKVSKFFISGKNGATLRGFDSPHVGILECDKKAGIIIFESRKYIDLKNRAIHQEIYATGKTNYSLEELDSILMNSQTIPYPGIYLPWEK